MERQLISSGAPWEAIVGYSRAVRVGNLVHVSGTTSIGPDGYIIGAGDAHAQSHAGAPKHRSRTPGRRRLAQDVVRTRMYVTDIDQWKEIGRAHGEVFRDVRPAATMVEVRRLISPDLLVEIEADAVIG